MIEPNDPNFLLKRIVASIKEDLPQFNPLLMRVVRQEMIANLPQEITDILKYLLLDPFPHISFKKADRVGPKEYAQYISKSKWYNVDIQDNNFSLLRFHFDVNEGDKVQEAILHLFVPYLFEEAFVMRGTPYYPIFTIMDKSIIRIKNRQNKTSIQNYIGIEVPSILQKVLFMFNEKTKYYFKDTEEESYVSTVLKVKAHHNIKGDMPPAILYVLAKYGWEVGMTLLGFDHGKDFDIVDQPAISTTHKFFDLNNDRWLVVPNNMVSEKETKNKRMLASLLMLFHASPIQSMDKLKDPEGSYFKFLLGKWIQKPGASLMQQINQAKEHLKTTDRTIDYRCKYHLNSDGIEVNDFYELCVYLFHSIDELLLHKNNNLFHKKISITPQILYGFIKVLSGELFRRTQSGDLLKADVLNSIFKKCTKLLIKHVERMSGVWMTHSDQCNDSWILGIGSKKSRQEGIRNPFEPSEGGKSPDGGLRSDVSVLSHPSHLFIESVLNLPASNPCKGGTINPFFVGVTFEGLFVKPEGYEKYANIFHAEGSASGDDEDEPFIPLTDEEEAWLKVVDSEEVWLEEPDDEED